MKVASALLLAILTALPYAALAQSTGAQQAGITVDGAWARASVGAMPDGVAYVHIVNTGGAADRLLGLSTPVAAKAELHETKTSNGMMTMRPVGPLPVAPAESIEFMPGGLHIMLVGLKHPLKQGETFPLTLSFEHAGAVQATVTVARANAMGMGGMDQGAMPGMDMSHGRSGPSPPPSPAQ